MTPISMADVGKEGRKLFSKQWANGGTRFRVEVEIGVRQFEDPKPTGVTIRIFDDRLIESYPCITATTIPDEVLLLAAELLRKYGA
jgi:hypothetical protein